MRIKHTNLEALTAKRGLAIALLAAAGLWVLPAAGFAQTDIDETRGASPTVRLSVELINGTVTVTSWDKKEVHIGGTLGREVEELYITGSEDRIHVEAEIEDGWRRRSDGTDLVIKMPVKGQLLVEGVNVEVSVDDLEGRLALETVNGSIEVGGTPSALIMETVNGPVRFTGSCPAVEAESVSGKIFLEGVTGSVSASTVSGSIDVSGGAFHEAEFSSVSGDVDFTGELNQAGNFDFESHSGTITILLTGTPSAEFDIETFSGDIETDYAEQRRSKNRWGPGKELFFTVGGGKAEVSITSFSGTVRVLEQ